MSQSSSPSDIQSQPLELELFWGKHKRRILAAALLVGLMAIGATLLFIRNYRILQVSETLFARASTVEQWQTLIAKYPSSKAAASALLLVAAEQRKQGKLEEADATYKKFLKIFPSHPLAPGAALGIVENILLAGHQEEGISALATLAARYPSAYTAPFALYTKANLLAHQPGGAPEAKRELLHLTTQFPNSISAQSAANLLVLLGSQQDSNVLDVKAKDSVDEKK